ncbi:MAG: response regulator transcription factor [Erysipelotrichaceae bacterium]|jgi:DNA-binding response OmpR family regulator|nr:response regulator transcription factor [Erysipelotrichaceae bacterium]MBQ1322728.1 response regulator transcription factor [Erysipelotrichaceae bacterium]MBQ1740279.1 response regulator transcription factor [Erysipelotrichaceae bacterium]MBQ1911031.1 response regulator transcription factor [Erysipelotrichaceae bacterium]MBQ2078067.1 response regulator transcription factor [Erysipelotrichaceae bacterium]
MAKLLIVDDEEKIREMIGKYAVHEGYETVLACDGKQAVELFKKDDFDLVVLDVMMPEMDGYEALKRIKQIKDVPCILLTALGQEYDRIYGFDIGAEDYVTKPFSPKELMMRIKVILKREMKQSNRIVIDGLVVDEDAHTVTVDGERVDMANKEYELLLYLVKNIGNALTRQSIISKVWGYEYDSDDRTLDTHMKLLRRDLKGYGNYIKTIRGVGYRFEKEV